ncbi:MAG: putative lipid II flippase FtsW, partial [Anaerolineales bacterium]
DWSYQSYGDSFQIASRQFVWVGLGILLLGAAALVPIHWWRRAAVPAMGLTLLTLVLVLLFGEDRFGARRSFLSGSIQPVEMAKLAMVLYAAAWLASKGDQVKDLPYGLIPFAVVVGVVAGLVLMQPDVGEAMLLVLTALTMFFVAGADIFQLSLGGVVGGVTFLVLVNQMPHAKERIDQYLITLQNPTQGGHHIRQALIALGSGGLLGVGLGQGEQKLGYLPAPHTDSVFAVLGEEMGLVGCLLVIGLFVLFAYRGFKIAMSAPTPFAAFLAAGVTCSIVYQALINIAVMTGLAPFTGTALPLISAGGSGMLSTLTGIGILLGIGRSSVGQSWIEKGRRQSALLDRGRGDWRARISRPSSRPGAAL